MTIRLTSPRPGVALITIDRPEKRNAFDVETDNRLRAIWPGIERDAAIRCIVLTGAGEKAFCAGADIPSYLPELRRRAETNMDDGTFGGMTRRVPTRKPIIAAINGDALGGGLELALASDIRLASAKARFGLPEVCVGVIAGGGGVTRLPRLLPPSLAAQMLLAGDMIDAETALVSGLVSRVYPNPAELIEAALDTAERIASNAPLAVEPTLSLIRQSRSLSLAEALEAERAAFRDILATADSVEGIAAFAERRPADFKGV